MDQLSDEEIMLTAQAGNREAMAVIFRRYKSKIFNFSLKMMNNRSDAEDATSDVFLALFSHKYSYLLRAKFSTWLFTIARNCCISRLRKRSQVVSLLVHRDAASEPEPWDIEDAKELSREALDKKEASSSIKRALKNLPYEQRDAIILREYEQFSYQEIAVIMNCSLDKVKVLIYRAREGLKAELTHIVEEA